MAVKARAEITLSSIRDVQSVTRYYLLQSSTSAVPTKPTTNPPGGNWVTTEPTYTSGSTNSLYFTDLTVFSDGTFVYSDVSLSSSYEAAKVAYNKADTAEGVANSASEKIDNLQVGGRNLCLHTLYPSTVAAKRPKFIGQTGPTAGRGTAMVAEHGFRAQLASSINWQYLYFGSSSNSAAVDMLGLEPGETYTFSADASFKLLSSATGMANETTYDFYTRLNYSKVTSGSFSSASSKTHMLITQADKGIEHSLRLVHTFTVPSNALRLFYGVRCACSTASHYATGDFIELRNIKLEKGSKATDWTPAPEDLDDALTAVQETADSKNTVYYQASDPTDGTYKVNDIWFDTNDGNKMYMWNGTAWTAETFGTAAISDLSITNAKIANATIQSAKIASLDAGKVTTGTMSAARIKGDTLTLGGANNVDGVMEVYDANGTLVGQFTREGLMAIAGTIGGWTIGETELGAVWDENSRHWVSRLAADYGISFEETLNDEGYEQWLRKVYYGLSTIAFTNRAADGTQASAFLSSDQNKITISPKLQVDEQIISPDLQSDQLELKELANGTYVRQPAMILSGVVTISTGTSAKNVTLCTVPSPYQSGYRIVPFVSRRYGSATGTPSDDGDFYYAYYNSVNHNVYIKLANALPSGVIYQFDYMIYAVPE